MKRRKVISSAEIISNNPDLLTQILLRLPTKTLLKFKCVSKHWLHLISDPHFCLSHTLSLQTDGFLTPTALLLKWIYTLPSEFDVVPLKHDSRTLPFFHYLNSAPNIIVLQSCYGLFLCKSVDVSTKNVIARHFICNPTTKRFKELSFPQNPFPDSRFYVTMGFDPLKSPHYKVVCVGEYQLSNYTLDVYSSETDSWGLSRILFSMSSDANIHFEDAVFCNGKIHWNSLYNDSLYFDVEKKILKTFPMPISTMEAPEERSYLGECRGVLYVSMTYFSLICPEMDVFEMASDYSHWTLKHRLYIGDIAKSFPEISWDIHEYSPAYHLDAPVFSDVCITRFEEDDEPKVVIWIENKVIFYDVDDGAWKSFYDLRPRPPGLADCLWDEYQHQSLHAYQYFENLSCV